MRHRFFHDATSLENATMERRGKTLFSKGPRKTGKGKLVFPQPSDQRSYAIERVCAACFARPLTLSDTWTFPEGHPTALSIAQLVNLLIDTLYHLHPSRIHLVSSTATGPMGIDRIQWILHFILRSRGIHKIHPCALRQSTRTFAECNASSLQSKEILLISR